MAEPASTYSIRTHLLFTPVENFQIAGLTVYQDEDNYLHFSRAYCDYPPPGCVGNGIYFDRVENGVFEGSNFATASAVTGEVYLRVIREGNNYTASFSTNGTSWTEVGTHSIGFEPDKVGLVAINQGPAISEVAADFDYFALTSEYFMFYLPLID
jgi:beta-xylosidase